MAGHVASLLSLLASAVAFDPTIYEHFLLKNVDANTGMPHSYYVPDTYFDAIPESLRPHHATSSEDVPGCGGEVGPDMLDAYELQTERYLSTLGLNIYDGAVRSVALAKLGHFDEVRSYMTDVLLAAKTEQFTNIRGDAPCKGDSFRDQCTDETQTGACGFCYGDDPSLSGRSLPKDNAYFFRMIGDYWSLEGTVDARCPEKGNTWIWNDYRPVLGENAWAGMVGPLQVEYLQAQGDYDAISDDSAGMKLALQILPAMQAMQIKDLGAIYYAPRNTFDVSNPDLGSDFSTENQASALAGLRMLHEILTQSTTTKHKGQLGVVEGLIDGIEAYFKQAYKPSLGYFSQGGWWDASSSTAHWAEEPFFAVDCQTWGVSVLGPQQVDAWFGSGTALKVWQTTKRLGGYGLDASTGWVKGVGYTDNNRDQVLSGEWTLGAINMLKSIHAYSHDPALLAEAAYMRQALADELHDDNTSPAGPSMLYASERYFIPFGWWANPVPALASSAWAVLEDSDYNVFRLGGAYSASKAPGPSSSEARQHWF